MSIRIDENPHKVGGDWHEYDVSFVPVENKKHGKVVELQGLEETPNKTLRNSSGKELGLYGLMPLKEAEKIYKELGEAIKALKG